MWPAQKINFFSKNEKLARITEVMILKTKISKNILEGRTCGRTCGRTYEWSDSNTPYRVNYAGKNCFR